MNVDEHQDDSVEASVKARLLVVLMILTGLLALWVIEPVISNIQPEEGATLAEIEQSIEELKDLINLVFIVSFLISLLTCVYFLNLAYQTHKAGRYPPPGFAVIRRVTIRRGQKARASAWFSFIFALFCWLPVLATAYLKWILLTVVI